MIHRRRLLGVFCTCGGEVFYENLHRQGLASREWAWEAFCDKCKDCDPNGYSTKQELLEESPKFWRDDLLGDGECK